MTPEGFNPTAAEQLLDQAGWVVGTDGIRSKNGVRAHLSLINGLGNRLAEETAQVIGANLQDVGIETDSRELPPAVLGGGFPANSPLSLGTFDLVVYLHTIPNDPQQYLQTSFASGEVPSPRLQTGGNWDRVQDQTLDQALAAASSTLDDSQRLADYGSVAMLVQADEASSAVPVTQVDARKSYVEGWGQTNVNDSVTWNVADWWLNQ